MALNANQISVAISGAISQISADYVVTSAEQDLSTDTGVINYGYASSDGVTVSKEMTTNKIVAWQGAATVRVTSSDATANYTFTLLQNTKEARELYFGSEEVNGKISWNPAKMPRGRFVIDYLDTEYNGGTDVLYGRHVIERGQVSSIGDLVYQNGEPVGYEITITAYPNEDLVVADIFHGTGVITEPVTP